MIKTAKNVYDKKEASDGKRVLVMRTWPRGISKERVDLWLKELGTEKELIHLWKTGKVGWDEFSREYLKSLRGKEDVLKELAAEAKESTVTLLCGCKDEKRCHRYLLRRAIEAYL